MNPTDDIDIIEALGIPVNRYEILDALGTGPINVSGLMARTGLSRGGVLKHLRLLQRASLVVTELRPTPSTRPVAYHSLDRAALASALDEIVAGR